MKKEQTWSEKSNKWLFRIMGIVLFVGFIVFPTIGYFFPAFKCWYGQGKYDHTKGDTTITITKRDDCSCDTAIYVTKTTITKVK